MRQPKPSKTLIAVAILVVAIGILSGCNSDTESYEPASSETVQNAESPQVLDSPAGSDTGTTNNFTVINTTFNEVIISPQAMSADDAANIGAQYIMDIFGENIDDMYVDMDFSSWEHMTRPIWSGAVSAVRRNIIENRAALDQLNETFMARVDAGEDMEEVFEDMSDLFLNYSYVMARFYFVIDAVTGMRVDIRQLTPEMLNQPMPENNAMEEYIDREWDGDWNAVFEAQISDSEEQDLGQLALTYAQKHFNTTTVHEAVFDSVFASLIYTGGGNFTRSYTVNFTVTDDTGREAFVLVEVASRTVISITTMNNDFIPFEHDESDGEWYRPREDDSYNDIYEGGYPAEQD